MVSGRKRARDNEGGSAAKRARSHFPRSSALKRSAKRSSARARQNLRTGGFLGIERKFLDTSKSSSLLQSSATCADGEQDPATVDCLNAPAQGDGESNRDGRQIAMDQITIRGKVGLAYQANLTQGSYSFPTFVALVLDTQANGATLSSENVYVNPSASAFMTTLCFRNLEYSKRFKVLRSEKIVLEPQTMSYDGTNIEASSVERDFEWNVDLKGMVVNYKGTGNGIADITDNALHMIGFCDIDNTAYLSYNSRLRFRG